METEKKDVEECDLSRRALLKKAYSAPVVIALGTMSYSQDAKAFGWHFWGGHHGGGHHGGGSSLGGGTCNICHSFPCCCKK